MKKIEISIVYGKLCHSIFKLFELTTILLTRALEPRYTYFPQSLQSGQGQHLDVCEESNDHDNHNNLC